MVETRCGYVATVGRPNAGKSSLLNWLIGEKIAMVSHKANATRKRSNIIAMHQGIDEKEESQVGDLVRIEECRPMSKTKRWRLVEILERQDIQDQA